MSFVLAIEVCQGKSEELFVQPEDNPTILAIKFVEQHKLPFQFHEQIANQIYSCREELRKKEEFDNCRESSLDLGSKFSNEIFGEKKSGNSIHSSKTKIHSNFTSVFERLHNDHSNRSQFKK